MSKKGTVITITVDHWSNSRPEDIDKVFQELVSKIGVPEDELIINVIKAEYISSSKGDRILVDVRCDQKKQTIKVITEVLEESFEGKTVTLLTSSWPSITNIVTEKPKPEVSSPKKSPAKTPTKGKTTPKVSPRRKADDENDEGEASEDDASAKKRSRTPLKKNQKKSSEETDSEEEEKEPPKKRGRQVKASPKSAKSRKEDEDQDDNGDGDEEQEENSKKRVRASPAKPKSQPKKATSKNQKKKSEATTPEPKRIRIPNSRYTQDFVPK
eukprot:TRINITY_DN4772_c0_g1_i1.p1 TRINITY_DN4772_c0_g1~~TRINITY_DN4772_c0_g1_i1.p1  ORF type:complete len:270 (-),score=71.55 TRINITY_DN4772_c0_g1_i1:27-836(-)